MPLLISQNGSAQLTEFAIAIAVALPSERGNESSNTTAKFRLELGYSQDPKASDLQVENSASDKDQSITY